MIDARQYYTTKELANRIGVSVTVVRKWKDRGRIPSSAFAFEGSNTFYRIDTIENMISNGDLEPAQKYEFHEPLPDELIHHENLELLPEHYERYMLLFQARVEAVPLPRYKSRTRQLDQIKNSALPLAIEIPDKTNEPMKGENGMSETYTSQELAEKLGVSWQTIASWKRYGTIPAKAVGADGRYKKTIIDSMIENGTFDDYVNENTASPDPETPKKETASKQETGSGTEKNFSEYARRFWNGRESRAVDLIVLPEETRRIVLEFVNDALSFGFQGK